MILLTPVVWLFTQSSYFTAPGTEFQLIVGRRSMPSAIAVIEGAVLTSIRAPVLHADTCPAADRARTQTACLPIPRSAVGVNDVPGAVKYELWVNNQTTGVNRIIHQTNLTGTSFTPLTDLGFGVHAAWVRGGNEFNQTSSWSAAESFFVSPELLGPDGPTFETQPTFNWTDLPGAETHEIYIRTNLGIVRQAGLTSNSFTPTTPLPDGTHRWWVRGFAANGKAGKWSDFAEVTIGGRPSILTPADSGTASSLPLFEWTAVTGAATYSLYISRIDVVGFTFRDDTLTTNAYTHTTALASGTYRAWVRAVSTSGTNSPWSIPVTFTVATVDDDETEANTYFASLSSSLLPEIEESGQSVASTVTQSHRSATETDADIRTEDSVADSRRVEAVPLVSELKLQHTKRDAGTDLIDVMMSDVIEFL